MLVGRVRRDKAGLLHADREGHEFFLGVMAPRFFPERLGFLHTITCGFGGIDVAPVSGRERRLPAGKIGVWRS
jgi:hypothetical protein